MKTITSIVLCLCGFFLFSGIALPDSHALSTAKANLPFIANKGQVHESVRFYAPTFTGTVFVTAGGDIVYTLPKADKRTVITETFVGASIRDITGQGQCITKINDFRGKYPSKWRSGISAYDSLDIGELSFRAKLEILSFITVRFLLTSFVEMTL